MIGNLVKSQTITTFESLITTQLTSTEKIDKTTYSNLVLRFYKHFISSQDGNGCGFYPSCSQFAIQKIKNEGLFLGIFGAFDCISRCNGHNHFFYLPYKDTDKIQDLPK